MRLPVKLSLLLAAATCFPLLLATAFTLPRGREALRSQLDEIYAQDARALAAEVHRSLVDKLDSLTLAASTLRLHELDPEAREQALLLIYKETRGADIVGLFDARAEPVGNIIRFPRLQGVLASEHEAIDDAALSSYAGKVPLQGALQAGLAIGPVYVVPDVRGRPIPRLVLAVAVPGTRNTRWVVAVEISLRRLAESFERFRPGGDRRRPGDARRRPAPRRARRAGRCLQHHDPRSARARGAQGHAGPLRDAGIEAGPRAAPRQSRPRRPLPGSIHPGRNARRHGRGGEPRRAREGRVAPTGAELGARGAGRDHAAAGSQRRLADDGAAAHPARRGDR